MDLQSGKLYWPTTYPNPRKYPRLEEDIQCDVLIVGGGSSGAQCAHYLADTGLDTVLIDKGDFASGSTSSNTGLIQYAGDKTFLALINTFGEEKAAKHLKLCEEAINEIEDISGKLPFSPDFARRNSLYYASDKEAVSGLLDELEWLRKYDFQVDFWTAEQVSERYPIHAPGALFYHQDAELNPYKFTHGLLESAHSRNVRMYEQTEWTGHKQEKDRDILYTKNKCSIEAKHVIFATGYANQEVKTDKNATVTSSYAIITSPVDDLSSWPDRTLLWETDRPYIYLRTTFDNRFIIGGLDETTNIAEERDRHLLSKKEQLLTKLMQRVPGIKVEADYYLGAAYGGTHDGLPILGVYDEYPHCTFLNAYGDNGLVYSMFLARMIRDMLIGEHPASAEIYWHNRPSPALAGMSMK